jgi:hypothetical protein
MKRYARFFILLFFIVITGVLNAQYNFNVIRTYQESNHEIVFASYNSDGTYVVTTGEDSSIIVWNPERRTIYRTLTGLKGRPNAAVITADNKFLFSGGRDNLVSKWDIGVIPPKLVQTFEGYNGPVKSVDISPDGIYLATGSAKGRVKIWDVRNNTDPVFDLEGSNKNADINSVVFSPDGKMLASGSTDGKVILWNTATGIMMGSQPAQKGIYHVIFSPDGKLLASCGYDNDIIIWQLPGLDNKVVLKGHKDWVLTIDFSPDSKNLISGGRDQYIILWDVTSGKILHKSDKQPNLVRNLDFNPSQPDFISTDYQSQEIEKWAISGLDETQWKRPSGITAEVKISDNQEKPVEETATNIVQQAISSGTNSMIEIFSPVPAQGKIVHDKNSILIVGRVSDPQGINTFLINKNVIKLSEGGVFNVNLNLSKGENEVTLVAINNKGIMNRQNLVIDCTAENALAAGEEIPEIAKSRYFALIIGINEYQDDAIPDLNNTVKDAETLYNVLLTKYTFEKENITFLRNPKQAEIINTLDELGKKLTSNDNLLIFYAGHGYWDNKAQVGYWFPSDAARNSKANWFSNSMLRDLMSGIETKHTILIADACFSGAIFKTRAAITEVPQGIQKLYELPSRKAMTSGNMQEVPDDSQFIKFLVKRLDENQDKYLPSELLFSKVKAAVMSNSTNVPQYGIIQNVGDEGGGDFIFMHR